MYQYHLGKDKAEKHVLALCKKLNIPVASRASLRKKITVQNGAQSVKVNFALEVDAAMMGGRALTMQSLHDSNDRYLNAPVCLGTISAGHKSGVTAHRIHSTYTHVA